jgi:hypothetical protein
MYIRLLYACELWVNCGIGSSQKLEQLQLEALRGKIISFPFLKGYTDVLCIVGQSKYKDN